MPCLSLTTVHSYTNDDENCDCGVAQGGKILSPGLRGSSKDSGCFRQRKVPPLRSRQIGCIGRRGYTTRMFVNVFNFLSSLQYDNIFDPPATKFKVEINDDQLFYSRQVKMVERSNVE